MNEMESANRKMVETMTSTERCGPRLCKKEQTNQWRVHCKTKRGRDKACGSVTMFGNKAAACWSIRRRTLRKERSDSHIFMFCTFFSLKWGISDFLALRAEVRWLKNLANSNLWWREKMDTLGHESTFKRIYHRKGNPWETVSSVNSTT